MIHTGKCPHCQKSIRKVKVEDVDICVGRQSRWKGFSYQCPSCSFVLSIQMNPLTLKDNLKNEIIDELAS